MALVVGFNRSSALPPASIVNTDNSVSTSNTNSYSFSSQSLGTASADRYIITAAGGRNDTTGSNNQIFISIGGNAATRITGINGSGNNALTMGLFILAVPTGTTATILVTSTANLGEVGLGVWAVTGIASSTAYDNSSNSGTSSIIFSMNNAAGGVGVAYLVTNSSNNRTFSWTSGMTEDFDATVQSGASTHSGGSSNYASANVGLHTNISLSGATTAVAGVAATFR
jgi:hypothetical protein